MYVCQSDPGHLYIYVIKKNHAMLNTEILNTHLFQSKFMVPVTQEHVLSQSLVN